MNYKEFLNSLTKNELKYLSRFQCAWCDHRLDRDGCSAMFGNVCSDETKINRAKECLKGYKPRKKRVK